MITAKTLLAVAATAALAVPATAGAATTGQFDGEDGEDGESFYRAIARESGLAAQDRYKVTPKRGKAFTVSKRLVLHVARDKRPAGTAGS